MNDILLDSYLWRELSMFKGKKVKLIVIICILFSTIISLATNSSNYGFNLAKASSFESHTPDSINTSDKSNCVKLGEWDPNVGEVKDIFVVDDLAFVACGFGGLQIINISDMANPIFLDNYEDEPIVSSIFVKDTYGYAICRLKLVILNVENPSNIFEVSSFELEGVPKNLVVVNHRVFVAIPYRGLYIIDVSNKANPYELSFYSIPGKYSRSIYVKDDFAYVCFEGDGLEIFDISILSSPFKVSSFNPTDIFYDFTMKDEFGYIAAYDMGVHIVNLTLKDSPTLLTTYIDPGIINDKPVSVSISEDILYYFDNVYLRAMNVSNPILPIKIDELNTGYFSNGIITNDQSAFLLLENFGLEILNISNPTNLTTINSIFFGGFTEDVLVSNDIAFVANQHAGLSILNVSDHSNPFEISIIDHDTLDDVKCLYLQKNLLYVGNFLELVIINVTDITNPIILSRTSIQGICEDIIVSGNVTFIASRVKGLEIYNTTDPLNPQFESLYSISAFNLGIDLVDNYIYLASFSNGLIIIDVSNIGSPEFVAQVNIDDNFYHDVQVFDGYAIVANTQFGMEIYDVHDLSSITKLSTRPIGQATSVYIQGDWVYAISYDQGFFVYNWLVPNGPLELASFDEGAFPERVHAINNTFYIANGFGGLRILELDMLDTDSDFLPDFLEDGYYISNKTNVDSDSDGYWDGYEVFNGYNPTDPNDPVPYFSTAMSIPIEFLILFTTISVSTIYLNRLIKKRKRK